jgi:hypothetical protein
MPVLASLQAADSEAAFARCIGLIWTRASLRLRLVQAFPRAGSHGANSAEGVTSAKAGVVTSDVLLVCFYRSMLDAVAEIPELNNLPPA